MSRVQPKAELYVPSRHHPAARCHLPCTPPLPFPSFSLPFSPDEPVSSTWSQRLDSIFQGEMGGVGMEDGYLWEFHVVSAGYLPPPHPHPHKKLALWGDVVSLHPEVHSVEKFWRCNLGDPWLDLILEQDPRPLNSVPCPTQVCSPSLAHHKQLWLKVLGLCSPRGPCCHLPELVGMEGL